MLKNSLGQRLTSIPYLLRSSLKTYVFNAHNYVRTLMLNDTQNAMLMLNQWMQQESARMSNILHQLLPHMCNLYACSVATSLYAQLLKNQQQTFEFRTKRERTNTENQQQQLRTSCNELFSCAQLDSVGSFHIYSFLFC